MEGDLNVENNKKKRVIQKSRPNWKSSGEYSYLRGANEEQFAWEFLRRSKAYQEDYKKYKNYPSTKEIKLNEETRNDKAFLKLYFKCDPPCKKGESYDDYEKRMIQKGYSMTNGEVRIISKRTAFYKKYDLKSHSNMRLYSPRNQNGPGFSFLNEKYPMFAKRDELGFLTELKETYTDQMVVKLCVLLPIDEQLEALKIELKKRAEFFKKKPDKKISDVDRANYICCLRILDATKENANDFEILLFIYRFLFENAHTINNIDELIKNYKLNVDKQKTINKRMNDDKKLADQLCNEKGYISIVKSRSHYLKKSQRKSTSTDQKQE